MMRQRMNRSARDRGAAGRRSSFLRAAGLPLFGIVGAALLTVLAATLPGDAESQDISYFRIGTGAPEASYFSIGGVIASAISNPPGSRACEEGGNCGVPGLIALAQTTRGSFDNLAGLAAGSLDSGLVQADVAEAAFTGADPYKAETAMPGLRAIGNLYQEGIHVVVLADSPITSVAELKNKRIALGEKDTDKLFTARMLLKAYGLSEKRVKPFYLPLTDAAAKLAGGELDAIVTVGSYPIAAIADLAHMLPIKLLPINDAAAQKLREAHPYLAVDIIPAAAYTGVEENVVTIGVGALWVVNETLDTDLVYAITQALWHESTRRLLDQSGPAGRKIRVQSALAGLPIPIHPGAARYYAEIGQMNLPSGETP